MNTAPTPNPNIKKFHESGIKLIQMDRLGKWHGYVSCLYRKSFSNEAEALAWLKEK